MTFCEFFFNEKWFHSGFAILMAYYRALCAIYCEFVFDDKWFHEFFAIFREF